MVNDVTADIVQRFRALDSHKRKRPHLATDPSDPAWLPIDRSPLEGHFSSHFDGALALRTPDKPNRAFQLLGSLTGA